MEGLTDILAALNGNLASAAQSWVGGGGRNSGGPLLLERHQNHRLRAQGRGSPTFLATSFESGSSIILT